MNILAVAVAFAACICMSCGMVPDQSEFVIPDTCPESPNFSDISPCGIKIECLSHSGCKSGEKCCSYGCGVRTKCFPVPQCWQPEDSGDCLSNTKYPMPSPSIRWRYDKGTRQCVQFKYSGCGGNENNFRSQWGCMRTCGRKYRPGSEPWDRNPPTMVA